jgi:hypothetical protein
MVVPQQFLIELPSTLQFLVHLGTATYTQPHIHNQAYLSLIKEYETATLVYML